MNKTILFGGSGTLGQELQKLNSYLICPHSSAVDIKDIKYLREFIEARKPNIIINAAAILNNNATEEAIAVNIIGAANIATICIELGIRLVYISTDYVYPGDKGNYLESDYLHPFNFYAWSKLGGECSSRGVKNHLIIRTSFGKSEFPYSHAFKDKWSSKDYVDRIAPMILEASLSDLTGVLNLGTERKTLFEYAKERNPHISPIKIEESQFYSPKDTSLNLQKWFDFKTNKSVKLHTNCRVCGSSSLTKYLDLGNLPLVNNLADTKQEALDKERFPLQIMFCEECGLSQLSMVVNPEKLYSYYTYRSSVNEGYVKHCKRMSDSLKLKGYLDSTSFVIDIAGNDGTLLKQFRQNSGCRILNIDPAKNITDTAISEGIPSICDFWGTKLVKDLHEKADVITATNVFAHCDNIKDFLQAVKLVLKPKGVLVLEFPYLIDFIEHLEFDTTYHEHLSYMSIAPIYSLAKSLDLKIIDVEKQDIHGGTVRVTISHNSAVLPTSSRVFEFIDNELDSGYLDNVLYLKWSSLINTLIEDLQTNLLVLKSQGYKIGAFAASAKGNTLLNSVKLDTDTIDYIIDQTPEKIGKFSPGTGIPILDITELTQNPPDFLLILAWNFKKEIMQKCKDLGFKGKFLIPIPKFEIID